MRHLVNLNTNSSTKSLRIKFYSLLAFGLTLAHVLPTAALAQGEAALRKTIRAHWVRPNADGDVSGRISALEMNSTIPLEELEVSLVKDGNKLYTDQTDSAGTFTFSDVTPDIYTLIASGKNGFMAYGLEVVPRPDDEELELDFGQREAAEKAYYAKLGLPAGAVVQDNLQVDAAAVPPTFNTMQRLTQSFLPGAGLFAADVKAIGNAEEVTGGFQHPLSEDGSFKGQLQPIGTKGGAKQSLKDMNIFLIQDDIKVAQVAIEEDGNFELKDIEPGVYAIVAAGKDGFAALSLELVASKGGDGNVNSPKRGILNVSAPLKRAAAPAIGIAIISNPADLEVIQQEVDRVVRLNQPNQPAIDNFAGAQAPFGPNGFPAQGGFSGPGSVGGAPAGSPAPASFSPLQAGPIAPSAPIGFQPPVGGGSIIGRRLLGLGGFAGLAVALADDDDDDDLPPVAASPSTIN